MTYSVQIKASAAKELSSIPRPTRQRLAEAIYRLERQPFADQPLKGRLRGLQRLRVGDYRIVYQLLSDQQLVQVIGVAHWSRAYRRT